MKAIHGGKAKNDKLDAHKIAVLLRGGMIPQAYVYPAEMRSTRDLLRRRMHLMHKRAELLAHVQNTNSQYNLPEIGKKIAYKANREGVAERFVDTAVQKSIEVDRFFRCIRPRACARFMPLASVRALPLASGKCGVTGAVLMRRDCPSAHFLWSRPPTAAFLSPVDAYRGRQRRYWSGGRQAIRGVRVRLERG